MRILILGGNGFLGQHVAELAAREGHEVTAVSRGISGNFPKDVTPVRLDRDTSDLDEQALPGEWEAVIDVASQPRWVGNAVVHLAGRARHFVYLSSISAYAPDEAHAGLDEAAALMPALAADRMESMEFYGGAKVRCEEYAQSFPDDASILRPGLIGGPGDATGRSGYWSWRCAQPGPALVPAAQDGPMQLIDVRDLAQFVLHIALGASVGIVDVTGTDTSTAELLEISGAGVETVAADTAWLNEHGVNPWMGPRSMPLWLPEADRSMFAHTGKKARGLGFRARPLAETIRESASTFAAQAEQGNFASGLSNREQNELLKNLIRGK